MITDVAQLPPTLASQIAGTDLIVFDGECVFCSGFFRFMLKHDRSERFCYAIAQGDLGQCLFRALELPTDRFETSLVIVDGHIYQRLDAFAAAMQALGGGWRILSVVRFLPRCIKDLAYHLIARNRYRMFGRYDTCMVPDPKLRARFI